MKKLPENKFRNLCTEFNENKDNDTGNDIPDETPKAVDGPKKNL